MNDPNAAMANIVRAAYEPVVKARLRDMERWNEMFPETPGSRERMLAAQQAEDDRIVSLMTAHLNEPGTTSVCRCGHVAYSTPGYLLHVYTVAASDFTNRWGLE